MLARTAEGRSGDAVKLIQITVQVDGEAAEAVSGVFNRYGKGGAVLEEVWSGLRSAPTVRIKTFLTPDEGCALGRIEEALWHLGQIYPIGTPEVRWLEEHEWADAWKSGYKTLKIGRRVVIRPSWVEHLPGPHELVIELDPGMAFGTGLHPSTQLAVLGTERMVRAHDSVLDVGTGSGILAILAARLGASSVIGLDIDPLAVDIAKQNIERNGVQGLIQVRLASLLPGSEGGCGREPELFDSSGRWHASFDLVLMNILAEVISRSAKAIADCLNSEGRFVLAGIIESQEEPLRQSLTEAGLRVTMRRKRKDWIALYGRKAHKGEPK